MVTDFDDKGEPYTIPGTDSGLDQFDGKLAAIDYTVQPEDGAAVCSLMNSDMI